MADLFSNIFGSGEAPTYSGVAPSVADQERVYKDQDAQGYKQEDATKGMAQDIQMEKPESFSQSAIQDRARRQYGDYLKESNINNTMQAQDEQQRQRMNNFDFASKVQRLVSHVQERKRIAMENQTAARNAVIGNVIGAAGAVAGGVMTGGSPMGIYAGSQLGRLAGNQQMQQGERLQSSGYNPQGPSYGRYGKNGFDGMEG